MTWSAMKLGNAIVLKRGYDLPNAQREDGPVPIVSSSGVTGFHKTAKVKASGVVTGRYETLGEVYYVEEDFWPLNTSLYVENFKGNHPRFIAYFLQSFLRRISSDKAAVPGVNRNDLHTRDILFPDLDTQFRISDFIATYDRLIENNRRRIQLLEQSARSLYKEWFVHLRFPGHEHVAIVDGVPEGWGKVLFSEVVDFKEGPGLRNYQYRNTGIPFLNIRTFDDDEIDISKTRCLDETEVFSKYQHFLLQATVRTVLNRQRWNAGFSLHLKNCQEYCYKKMIMLFLVLEHLAV